MKVIENAVGGRLSVSEAARLLQLSERQVQRLKRRAIVPTASIGRITATADGPCLGLCRGAAAHHLRTGPRQVSRLQRFSSLSETSQRRASVGQPRVRAPFCAAKFSSPQKRRARQYRARRLRRPRFGMMVLTDASRHDWLEGRGPELTLMGFEDDATSQISLRSFSTRSGKYSRLYARSARHGHHSRRAAQPLPRPPRHLSAQRCPLDRGRTTRRKTVPHLIRPGSGGTRHPANPRCVLDASALAEVVWT